MLIEAREHELRIGLILSGAEVAVIGEKPEEEPAVFRAVSCGDVGRTLDYIGMLREERGREVDASVGREILGLSGNIVVAEGLAVLCNSRIAGHLICFKHAVTVEFAFS